MKEYHLHKQAFSKLQFELNDGKEYCNNNKEHSTIPHKHSFYQLIWFKQSGRHYVDYEVINHEESTIFFISKNQIHHFCSDAVNEGIMIHFNGFFIDQFDHDLLERISLSIFNEIEDPFVKLDAYDQKRFVNLATLISEELTLDDTYLKEQVFSLFRSLLFTIERAKRRTLETDISINNDFQLAYAFKKMAYENISKFLSMEAYYDLLRTNKRDLAKISREYLKSTPAKVIQDIKILEAKRSLVNKKLSIQEIAYDLGFDQATYFTKYFKKVVGITPKEFRLEI
ncbi:AraC family transcriptional regulator [uncultured Flavobacterium sp.]|uniref:helix-turn-helix domain-containing protein n=1 Tax=uncultured Flavobacterium sp. TaxID=165435 RepID=UPI0030CA203A